MEAAVPAFVALGSNLGDRHAALGAAVHAVGTLPGVRLMSVSTIRETAPVGPVPQGPYLNGMCAIETTLAPRALLDALLEIERRAGRDRAHEQRWGPRTLDLDLILFGEVCIEEPGLTVPHPRLAERRFVLEPLAELAPEARVPPGGRCVRELLEALGGAEDAS